MRKPKSRPPTAFAPDGKVLAVAVSITTIRLFDTETWRPLARLQAPDTDSIGRMLFTPDGSRLLIAADGGGTIRVWDLGRIRAQLAEVGLDWNQPAYPPAPPPDRARPMRVEVDVAEFERLKGP